MDWSTFDWKNYQSSLVNSRFTLGKYGIQQWDGSHDLYKRMSQVSAAFANAGYRPRDWDSFYKGASDYGVNEGAAQWVYIVNALDNGTFDQLYAEAMGKYNSKFGASPLEEAIATAYGIPFGLGSLMLTDFFNGDDSMAGNTSTLDYLNFGLGTSTSLLNLYMQYQAQKAQAAQVAFNNAMSYQMFQEGNQFNRQEAIDAFNRSYEASKYATQKKNMEAAGLNPAMMFGEGNTIQPPQSQAGSSLGAPSMASNIGMTVPGLDLSGLSQIANSLKSLADAKKSGAEVDEIYAMLQEKVKDQVLRNEYQEIINSYQGKKSAAEIANLLEDIEVKYTQIDNMIKEGRLIEAKTALEKVNKEIADENKLKAKADREIAESLAARREEYTNNILKKQEEDIKTTVKLGQMYDKQGVASLQSAAAALMQGKAALNNAEVNRLNGIAQRDLWAKEGLKVDALRQLTDAQKMDLCQSIAGAMVLSNGDVHVDGVKQEWMQQAMMREMYNQIRQQGADYWNPFKYIGHVFGGSVGMTKVLK